ncbi:GCN5-related N-acetyltransferase [Mucor mucedo]|nr:GCN5-related N-acetyltransferase [Mucor mucedo]KAI7868659.1 GCN5-related N-acetyltransferase [Mucor mucedo]
MYGEKTKKINLIMVSIEYSIVESVPPAEKFCELRKRAGLSPKSVEVAKRALPHTVYGVSVVNNQDNSIVGMGRIVGDRYLALTIVDVAVFPEHQKKGLGKLIMETLMTYIKANVTRDCYITLMADGDAKFLYEKYGFITGLPISLGMYYSHPKQ